MTAEEFERAAPGVSAAIKKAIKKSIKAGPEAGGDYWFVREEIRPGLRAFIEREKAKYSVAQSPFPEGRAS